MRPKANPNRNSNPAPTKSVRPKTRSDYETEHAVGASVKYQRTGGKVRGMGAAKKGGKFSKNG